MELYFVTHRICYAVDPGFLFLDAAELIRDMSQRSESIIRGITLLCILPHGIQNLQGTCEKNGVAVHKV
jgi:hypothetical protein